MGPRQPRANCEFANLLFPNSNSNCNHIGNMRSGAAKCGLLIAARARCLGTSGCKEGGDDRPSWATLTRRARGRAVQHDVLSDSVAGCSLRLSMPSLQATANAAMIFAMLKPMPMPSAARTEPHVRNLPSALLRCRLSASQAARQAARTQ